MTLWQVHLIHAYAFFVYIILNTIFCNSKVAPDQQREVLIDRTYPGYPDLNVFSYKI